MSGHGTLETRLREELRANALPGEDAAAGRARPVVAAAFAERSPAARRRGGRLGRVALAFGLVGVTLVAALTPAGAEVGEWIEERVGLGPEAAKPSLVGFPRGGRLLAVSPSGAWVVDPGGDLRRLGDYRDVDWSPRGLYVAGTLGRRVTAVEPDGDPRWSIARPGRVSRPAWSPGDGFRVAYLERSPGAGFSARVVDGSGRLDHELLPGVAPVRPAWRPGRRYVLTVVTGAAGAERFSKTSGGGPGVITLDADDGARLWAVRTGQPPLDAEWTRRGDRLVVLLPTALRVYGRGGRLLAERSLPAGARPRALAVHPRGRRAALALSAGGVSRVLSIPLTGDLDARRKLFTGSGTFSDLEWAPNGRRLLVGWPDANQWLLLGGRRPQAFAGVSRELDPGGTGVGFPRLAGWCCGRSP